MVNHWKPGILLWRVGDRSSETFKHLWLIIKGENTRLRHYLAGLQRKTLCYSKSLEMLKYSIRLLLHYLKFKTIHGIA